MTWYELIFWCIIPIILVGMTILASMGGDDPINGFGMGLVLCVVYVALGGFACVICKGTHSDSKETACVKIIPISAIVSHDGLDVVFPDHTHRTFKDYRDVEKWKNGGSIYLSYRYGKVPFGPDNEETNVIIE